MSIINLSTVNRPAVKTVVRRRTQRPSVLRVLLNPDLAAEVCKFLNMRERLAARKVCRSFRDAVEHLPNNVNKRCLPFSVVGTVPTMQATVRWYRLFAEYRDSSMYCRTTQQRLMALMSPGAEISMRDMSTITASNPIVPEMGLLHSAILRIACVAADINMLSNVHTLDLSYSSMLTDVSMLGNAHTLNLTGCTLITTVSMLGNVHSLNLEYCTGVTDASALGGVHTLVLTASGVQIPPCETQQQYGSRRPSRLAQTSLAAKRGAYVWKFREIPRLVSANFARGVVEIDLSYCHNIVDVSALRGARIVNLAFCSGVADVSMLGDLHTLDIAFCTRVTDVSMLGRLKHLSIAGCTRVTDVSALVGLRSLNLYKCTGVVNVRMLGALRELSLGGYPGKRDMRGLTNVVGLCWPKYTPGQKFYK